LTDAAPPPTDALNALETALFDNRDGRASVSEIYAQLPTAELCVPSAHEVEPDGRGLRPVIFHNKGVNMVAAFTDLSRMEDKHRELAPHVLKVSALRFILSMPTDHGLVLFSGSDDPFAIPPVDLAAIRTAAN
jgi:hypothetical protein